MRTLTTLAGTLLIAGAAFASSHREAPGIAGDPAADNTDLYSFKSPATPGNQVFIMNFSPGYIPQAGPNWYGFDPNVLYELNIDTDGDGVEDVTYQFQFKNVLPFKDKDNGVSGILSYSGAAITFDSTKNVYSGALSQTYTVKKVTGGRRSATSTVIGASGLTDFPVAPPRIGPFVTDGGLANKTDKVKRYAAYEALAKHAEISADNGYKFFAGPRNDPFFVDLGGIFDGVQVRLLNGVLDPASTDLPVDSLAGVNVLSIVFEVPVTDLGSKDNFGVWATTSRPQASVRRIIGNDSQTGGGWVQVSRLGNPLVNEVVIGVKDKDKFNATEPKDDVTNFAGYVIKPALASVLNSLYGSNGAEYKNLITDIPDGNNGTQERDDLVDVFVTGIPGVSAIPGAKGNGDMLRVNRKAPLGEGWPLNGRKLEDDVVAIALSFLAGCAVLPAYGNYDITGVKGGFGTADWSKTHTVAKPATYVKADITVKPANCLLDDGVANGDTTPGAPATLAAATGAGITPAFMVNNGLMYSDDTHKTPVFPYIDLPFPAY